MKRPIRHACSLFLTAALAAGLMSVPAAAEEIRLSVSDGVKPISYQFLNGEGEAVTYPSSEKDFQVGVNYVKTGTFGTYQVEGFYTIPEDASLRLSNKGGKDDCYLTISVVSFEAMDKEEILAKYARKIEKQNQQSPDDPVELEEGVTYYVYSETDWGGKYLCEDGQWINGASRPENILHVEERENYTFSLPDAADGNLYRVDFQAYYPESINPDYYYYWRFYVKVDAQAQDVSQEQEPASDQEGAEETAQPEAPAFTDVAEDAWYAEPVAWAVENGITSGTGNASFSPAKTCTTAEILTFLWRAAGSPEPTGEENPFTDVAEDAYYFKPALWAYEQGLLSGTQLQGDTPCTRASTVTYLWKLAGSPEMDAPDFTDVPADADYAQAVAWAVENGITSGTGNAAFSPDRICDRSQIVTFLYQDFAETE